METDALWTDRPVSIQVGGKTFACRLSTLRRFPDALLWKAYSFNTNHFDLVFWDRNPRVFEALLDYYRTNRLSLPRDLGLKTIQDELQFWGFDVDLPSRPPWPVLPRYKEHLSMGTNTIRYPLGMALRESAGGCHYVLLCLVWSALGNSSSVWDAAQRGYRSICIYWKTRAPGMDSTILKSNFKTLSHLAELDGCVVSLLPPVTTTALSTEVRNHDVYTHGHLHSSGKVQHVAEWKVEVSYSRDGHEVVMNATSKETLVFSFDHRGFRITFKVLGERIWWYMNPLHLGEENLDSDIDMRLVEDSQGFILDVSFVLGTTLFQGFIIPSSYYRANHLRADIFMAQTFQDVPDDDTWYRSECREKLRYETSLFDFGSTLPPSETTEMIVLVEQKQDVTLVCHAVNNIVPFSSTMTFSPSAYDRLLIEW